MALQTRVGIVGAGPAGLLLALLLNMEGIDAIILEDRSREEIEETIRAGVLEQGTVDLMTEVGVAEHMHRNGMVHHGINLRFNGADHRIDLYELTNGRSITVYPQNEVVKDFIAAWLNRGGQIFFNVKNDQLIDITADHPCITFVHENQQMEIQCDFIVGCDGFHGICRPSIHDSVQQTFNQHYPFAWLGILMEAPQSSDELIYCHSDRGFALVDTRLAGLSASGSWPDRRHRRLWLRCLCHFFGFNGWVPMTYAWSAENFPTRARVTGFGIVDGAGHVGGGIGLVAITPILPQIGAVPSFLLIGGFLVVAAIIAQFGVNTRGKSLEDVSP